MGYLHVIGYIPSQYHSSCAIITYNEKTQKVAVSKCFDSKATHQKSYIHTNLQLNVGLY